MDFGSLIGISALAVGVLGGAARMFVVSICLLSFGALAILPPSLTSGVSITASSMGMLVTFFLAVFKHGFQPFVDAAVDSRRLAFLTYFTLIVVFVSITAPFFSEHIYAYPVRSSGPIIVLERIRFTTSNLTQTGYIVLSWLSALTVSVIANDERFRISLNGAFLGLAFLLILTGMIDLSGNSSFLSIFRNASYALVGDTSVASARRVVGAMPEASTYGAAAAGLFGSLVLMRSRFQQSAIYFVLTFLVGVFAVLSTSSTAYGMVGAVFVSFVIQIVISVVAGDEGETASAYLYAAAVCFLLLLLIIVILSFDSLFHLVDRLLDDIVFRKALSGSFEERTRWTIAGWDALVSSFGVGVGAGSVRTSNGLVNILASGGLLGGILFVLFFIRLFVCPPAFPTITERLGAPLALFPIFVGMALAGTTPDYGILAAVLFGLQSQCVDV